MSQLQSKMSDKSVWIYEYSQHTFTASSINYCCIRSKLPGILFFFIYWKPNSCCWEVSVGGFLILEVSNEMHVFRCTSILSCQWRNTCFKDMLLVASSDYTDIAMVERKSISLQYNKHILADNINFQIRWPRICCLSLKQLETLLYDKSSYFFRANILFIPQSFKAKIEAFWK